MLAQLGVPWPPEPNPLTPVEHVVTRSSNSSSSQVSDESYSESEYSSNESSSESDIDHPRGDSDGVCGGNSRGGKSKRRFDDNGHPLDHVGCCPPDVDWEPITEEEMQTQKDIEDGFEHFMNRVNLVHDQQWYDMSEPEMDLDEAMTDQPSICLKSGMIKESKSLVNAKPAKSNEIDVDILAKDFDTIRLADACDSDEEVLPIVEGQRYWKRAEDMPTPGRRQMKEMVEQWVKGYTDATRLLRHWVVKDDQRDRATSSSSVPVSQECHERRIEGDLLIIRGIVAETEQAVDDFHDKMSDTQQNELYRCPLVMTHDMMQLMEIPSVQRVEEIAIAAADLVRRWLLLIRKMTILKPNMRLSDMRNSTSKGDTWAIIRTAVGAIVSQVLGCSADCFPKARKVREACLHCVADIGKAFGREVTTGFVPGVMSGAVYSTRIKFGLVGNPVITQACRMVRHWIDPFTNDSIGKIAGGVEKIAMFRAKHFNKHGASIIPVPYEGGTMGSHYRDGVMTYCERNEKWIRATSIRCGCVVREFLMNLRDIFTQPVTGLRARPRKAKLDAELMARTALDCHIFADSVHECAIDVLLVLLNEESKVNAVTYLSPLGVEILADRFDHVAKASVPLGISAARLMASGPAKKFLGGEVVGVQQAINAVINWGQVSVPVTGPMLRTLRDRIALVKIPTAALTPTEVLKNVLPHNFLDMNLDDQLTTPFGSCGTVKKLRDNTDQAQLIKWICFCIEKLDLAGNEITLMYIEYLKMLPHIVVGGTRALSKYITELVQKELDAQIILSQYDLANVTPEMEEADQQKELSIGWTVTHLFMLARFINVDTGYMNKGEELLENAADLALRLCHEMLRPGVEGIGKGIPCGMYLGDREHVTQEDLVMLHLSVADLLCGCIKSCEYKTLCVLRPTLLKPLIALLGRPSTVSSTAAYVVLKQLRNRELQETQRPVPTPMSGPTSPIPQKEKEKKSPDSKKKKNKEEADTVGDIIVEHGDLLVETVCYELTFRQELGTREAQDEYSFFVPIYGGEPLIANLVTAILAHGDVLTNPQLRELLNALLKFGDDKGRPLWVIRSITAVSRLIGNRVFKAKVSNEKDGILVNEDPTPQSDGDVCDSATAGLLFSNIRPMTNRDQKKSKWGQERQLAMAAILAVLFF